MDAALGHPGTTLPGPTGDVRRLLDGSLTHRVPAHLWPLLTHRDALAGALLFSKDDPPTGLWFVQAGLVRLFTADADGREQTLQIVQEGGSFNEAPFFDLGREPMTAQALEDASLLVLPMEHRDEALDMVPELATVVTVNFAFRLRQAIALVEDLSFRQVAGRVARVVLQSVAPHAGVGAGSEGRPVTQQEIAEMVGSSREVVARALRQLEREGLIRMEHGRIMPLDRLGLASRQ